MPIPQEEMDELLRVLVQPASRVSALASGVARGIPFGSRFYASPQAEAQYPGTAGVGRALSELGMWAIPAMKGAGLAMKAGEAGLSKVAPRALETLSTLPGAERIGAGAQTGLAEALLQAGHATAGEPTSFGNVPLSTAVGLAFPGVAGRRPSTELAGRPSTAPIGTTPEPTIPPSTTPISGGVGTFPGEPAPYRWRPSEGPRPWIGGDIPPEAPSANIPYSPGPLVPLRGGPGRMRGEVYMLPEPYSPGPLAPIKRGPGRMRDEVYRLPLPRGMQPATQTTLPFPKEPPLGEPLALMPEYLSSKELLTKPIIDIPVGPPGTVIGGREKEVFGAEVERAGRVSMPSQAAKPSTIPAGRPSRKAVKPRGRKITPPAEQVPSAEGSEAPATIPAVKRAVVTRGDIAEAVNSMTDADLTRVFGGRTPDEIGDMLMDAFGPMTPETERLVNVILQRVSG